MRHTTRHQRAAYDAATHGDIVSARLHWLIAASMYRPGAYRETIERMVADGSYARRRYLRPEDYHRLAS